MASEAQFMARVPFRKAFFLASRPMNWAVDAINVVPTYIPIIWLKSIIGPYKTAYPR